MADPTFYSTVADVLLESHVKPADLDLVDIDGGATAAEQLQAKIEGWLTEATDLINNDRNRNYLVETSVPAGIHMIARQVVCNMIAQVTFRRNTPIVRVGEFAVRMPDDTVFTRAIRAELMRYPATPKFRFMRVARADEEEEET